MGVFARPFLVSSGSLRPRERPGRRDVGPLIGRSADRDTRARGENAACSDYTQKKERLDGGGQDSGLTLCVLFAALPSREQTNG